jgi:small-conductance mechanosensitive channel
MSTPEEDMKQSILREVREELRNTLHKEEDIKQLELLATFHYILGGIVGLVSCIPLIHVVIGFCILVGALIAGSPIAFLGLQFIIGGLFFIVLGWATAICLFMAGRNLNKRTCYRFCFVVACVECIFMPFGTILGIFTIIALSKDSVKGHFRQIGLGCGHTE